MPTPSPVTPSDAKALISDPTDSLCGNFVNTLLRGPVLFYNFLNWFLNADGTINANITKQIQQPGDLIWSAAPLAESSGRLLCNGSEVSKTTYAALYAAIGDTYGSAGPGNFKLPDARCRFPLPVGVLPTTGTSVELGSEGGEETHTLITAEMPAHVHNTQFHREVQTGADTPCLVRTGTDISIPSDSTGGDAPHNTMPPYIGFHLYIAV